MAPKASGKGTLDLERERDACPLAIPQSFSFHSLYLITETPLAVVCASLLTHNLYTVNFAVSCAMAEQQPSKRPKMDAGAGAASSVRSVRTALNHHLSSSQDGEGSTHGCLLGVMQKLHMDKGGYSASCKSTTLLFCSWLDHACVSALTPFLPLF